MDQLFGLPLLERKRFFFTHIPQHLETIRWFSHVIDFNHWANLLINRRNPNQNLPENQHTSSRTHSRGTHAAATAARDPGVSPYTRLFAQRKNNFRFPNFPPAFPMMLLLLLNKQIQFEPMCVNRLNPLFAVLGLKFSSRSSSFRTPWHHLGPLKFPPWEPKQGRLIIRTIFKK